MHSVEDRRDVLHYYVDTMRALYLRNAYSDTLLCRSGAAHYVYTRRVSPTRAVRNAYAAADENISWFGTIIGFPFNRILFHSSSAYRTIETRPITDMFFTSAYWNLLSTICRRNGNRILRASNMTHARR